VKTTFQLQNNNIYQND